MKRVITMLIICLCFSAVPAFASDDHERIEALESRVDALEQTLNDILNYGFSFEVEDEYEGTEYYATNPVSYGHQVVFSNDVFDVFLEDVATDGYRFTIDNKSDGRYTVFILSLYVNGEEISEGDMCTEMFAQETGRELVFDNYGYHGYDLPTEITSMSGTLEIQECEEIYGDFFKDFDFSCEITPPEAA